MKSRTFPNEKITEYSSIVYDSWSRYKWLLRSSKNKNDVYGTVVWYFTVGKTACVNFRAFLKSIFPSRINKNEQNITECTKLFNINSIDHYPVMTNCSVFPQIEKASDVFRFFF